jgi:GGDEF domain-containing protein
MKKIRNYKILQLILITAFGIIGYIFIFRKTSPETMGMDMIPISRLYECFFAGLILFLAFIVADLFLLSRLEVEKQGLDKLSYLDPVTGGLNRMSADMLIHQYETPDKIGKIGCFVFTLTNLVEINKKAGYLEGDRLLRMFFAQLETNAKDGIISRNIPDRFIVIFPDADRAFADDFLDRISRAVRDYNVDAFDLPIEYTVKMALNCEEHRETASELIIDAIAKPDRKEQI